MREKFVHIASFALIVVLLFTLSPMAVSGDPGPEDPEWPDVPWEDPFEDAPWDDPFEDDPFGEGPGESDPGTVGPGEEDPSGQDPGIDGPTYSDPDSGYAGVGAEIIRIGIYYGTAGRKSVEVKLERGDGFWFGTFDNSNAFIPAPGVAPVTNTSIVVKADTGSKFGFIVEDARGNRLYTYDDTGAGTGLAVMPFSSSGEKTRTKCGYTYFGGFRFERFNTNNELMTVVNYVPLDDYLKGVVPYESSASWPIEALKAQAVAARTYALSKSSSAHRKYHFDLCDGNDCQVYKGIYNGSNASVVDASVDETSGVTVQYEGKYCETLFCSSNGGATESNCNVYTADLPYLRGKLDPYEAYVADSIKDYYWTKTFTGKELQKKLVESGRNIGVVVSVKTTLSETGNVIGLTFADESGKTFTLYKNSCRTFLTLRSLRYSVSSEEGAAVEVVDSGLVYPDGEELDLSQGVPVIDGDGNITTVSSGYLITADGVEKFSGGNDAGVSGATSSASGTVFTFSGTGWGHNLGMSQYGALAMAQLGYTYQEILEFYYTGATVA